MTTTTSQTRPVIAKPAVQRSVVLTDVTRVVAALRVAGNDADADVVIRLWHELMAAKTLANASKEMLNTLADNGG